MVSGLAAGIDTIAHTLTIELGGRTIAVIGTPLDGVFPKGNAALSSGSPLSASSCPGFRRGGGPRDFVRCNRTMALIAHAALIIEVGEELAVPAACGRA